MNKPLKEAETAFYEQLWNTEQWGGRTPNIDESARYEAIKKMIDIAGIGVSSTGKDIRILDVGCGRGWLTNLLSGEGNATGIDPTESSIKAALKLFPNGDFRCVTTGDLLKDRTYYGGFDLVICSEVIEHVPDEDKGTFLREMHDLLRRNGYLILTTPRGELWRRWKKLNYDEQPVEDWITEKQLRRLSEQIGFKRIAHDRSFRHTTPLNWRGWIYKYIINRKFIRRVPLPLLRKWLAYNSYFYQVALMRKDGSSSCLLP